MKDNIHAQTEQRDRPRNEDRSWAGKLRLSDKTSVFAAMVADGVGGHRFGAEVAEMAIDALKHAIERAAAKDFAGKDEIRAWLDTWAPKLQEDVRAAYPLGFSTLCAAIQIGKDVVLLSVGDSPVFQMGAGTGIRRVFEPHTRGQVRIKNGEEEDEIDARDFSVLTRAVGLQQDGGGTLLDFQRVKVTEPTWFLLGSDGVFNYLEGIELFKTISAMKRPGASEIAAVLLTRSLDNGRRTGKHLDNATIAVLGVMQKTKRKRRTAAGRTGGGARRLGICILVALLVVLVGVLAAGLFFRDVFTSTPTVADDPTTVHVNRVEPVVRNSGNSRAGDAAPGETFLPPSAADAFPEPQTLPPSEETISGATDGTVPPAEIPPTRVVLRVRGTETNVAERIIWCAYSDHSTTNAPLTGDWYDIPDAQNVMSIELGDSGTIYDVARDGNEIDGMAVWHLIPRYQSPSDRGKPSGELPGARGRKPGPKQPPPFFKGDAEATEPPTVDKSVPEHKTDDRGGGAKSDSESENGADGNIGPMPESDSPSAPRKGSAQNFIALQLSNEVQEYRGKATIEFSNGKRAEILGDRPYGLFRIGAHTISEIEAIVVWDGSTSTTYTNKEKWRFTNMKQGQLFDYILVSIDNGPDGGKLPGMSPDSQQLPAATSSAPIPSTRMTGTDKTGRTWP